jgi:peptidoglycan/LPS O-acetylase OafA/YrhL
MTKTSDLNHTHYYGLDILRAFAILSVIFFHFTYKIHDLYPNAHANLVQFPYGEFPVFIFFSLSGFLIIPSLERYSVRDFFKLRLIRLYPVFILGCITTSLILCISPLMGFSISIKSFLVNLTFFAEVFAQKNIDGAYWILPYEIGFYSFCGFFTHLISKKKYRYMPILLIIMAFIFIKLSYYIPSPLHFFLMITNYTHFFCLGISLYFMHSKKQYCNFIDLIPIIGVFLIEYYYRDVTGIIEILLIIILFIIGTSHHITYNVITKPLINLAYISYSLYIFHQMIGITIIAHLEEIGINANIATLMTTIFMIVIAYYITYYYDIPIGKKLRQKFI